MKVRDHTKSVKEYKGKWTWAVDELCPCRPCFNAHDCGHSDSHYGWIERFACAVNHNSGCPQPKPEPQHVLSGRQRICRRCGVSSSAFKILGELRGDNVG